MRVLLFSAALLVSSTALAQDVDDGSTRPAHFGTMYSCMTMPPEGPPYIGEGVPYVVEHRWVGYSVSRDERLTVAGLRFFVAHGRAREDGFAPRFSTVVAVDESGALIEDRALFVRVAASGDLRAFELARAAMAILLSRADEQPLSSRSLPSDLAHPEQVVDPVIAGGVLTFSLRARPSGPYANRVTVELATGIASGDSW
jgi:hypothetical protein